MKAKSIGAQSVVENWDLSTDNENENTVTPQQKVFAKSDLEACLKIKQERVETLETAIKHLNDRVGTEVIDDYDDDNAMGATSLAIRRYKRNQNRNTLNYQIDSEFGKDLFFITDVRNSNIISNSTFISLFVTHSTFSTRVDNAKMTRPLINI